jgi:hypothetical protein
MQSATGIEGGRLIVNITEHRRIYLLMLTLLILYSKDYIIHSFRRASWKHRRASARIGAGSARIASALAGDCAGSSRIERVFRMIGKGLEDNHEGMRGLHGSGGIGLMLAWDLAGSNGYFG